MNANGLQAAWMRIQMETAVISEESLRLHLISATFFSPPTKFENSKMHTVVFCSLLNLKFCSLVCDYGNGAH